MSSCYLSVVIPAYNEAGRLPETLTTLNGYLGCRSLHLGSHRSRRRQRGRHAGHSPRICADPHGFPRLYLPTPGQGRGGETGDARRARRISFPLRRRFVHAHRIPRPAAAARGAGCRYSDRLPGSPRSPAHRRTSSPPLDGSGVQRIHAACWPTPGIADTQCGFKVFTGPAAEALFPAQTLDGFAFDAEILFLARKRNGFSAAEVGIDWHYRAESKVRPFRDGWRTLRDLLLIRWRWLRLPGNIAKFKCGRKANNLPKSAHRFVDARARACVMLWPTIWTITYARWID